MLEKNCSLECLSQFDLIHSGFLQVIFQFSALKGKVKGLFTGSIVARESCYFQRMTTTFSELIEHLVLVINILTSLVEVC